MDFKKEKEKIIKSAEKALVELRKVAEQTIDLNELDVEKAKTAAAAKRLAVEDSFVILQMIQQESENINETPDKENKTTSFFGVESKVK